MFRMAMLLMVAVGLITLALWVPAQPPGEGGPGGTPKGPPPKGEKGPRGEGKFGGAKGKGKRFQPGTVIPPHVVGDLELTEVQSASIRELETEVKNRLEKILTPEQLRIFREARPPMGGPPGGLDGPPGAGRAAPKGPARPNEKEEVKAGKTGGIQWFSTWQSARAEAARTGRPILLVSAAPHCGGIPGIW